METLYDVIIIGGGPAGLSGAMVLGRCDRKVLLCDDGRPRNLYSHAMHGFLSRDGTPPGEFLEVCREQLSRYPSITLRREEVVDVCPADGGFEVVIAGGAVARSKKLLLATGLVDELPPIPGLRERWGSSVFPCPFCDGWEYRGQPMAVYGTGASASCAFTLEMLTWTRQLTLLTDGSDDEDPKEAARLERLGVTIERRRIKKLEGEGTALSTIHVEGGHTLPCSALFIMTSQHQRTGFAEKLGCTPLTEDAAVPTGPLQHTRARGVYAAGNASVGLQAAILAAAEGFKAAYAINDELIEEYAAERLGEASPPPEHSDPKASPCTAPASISP